MLLGKVEVSGVNATVTYRETIPRGIVGATVEITFTDPLWDELTKTVVFWGSTVKDVQNPGTVVEIPREVVAVAGHRLRVGVYGVDTDNNLVIPTLWADLGTIKYSAEPSGDETCEPQLPAWARMWALIGDLQDLETEDKSNLVAAINEVHRAAGNEAGLSGTEKNLILSLFRNAVYATDMSAEVAQLEALWSSAEDDTGGETESGVTQTAAVLTVSHGVNVAQNGYCLSIT